MAMRYIIRRSQPEDLSAIKKEFPQLDSELSKAGDGLRKTVAVSVSNLERVNYQFQTKKTGTEWVWICPTIELVADNEPALFALMERFSVAPPAHLAHLKQ
ncbi:MAG: hypothetical protein EBQ85_05465 [Proteobacteria bacterium]|nr:hypothetical protein [Pseudomonadota bacterium]